MEKNKKEPELKAADNQTVENFAKKKKRFIIEKMTDLPVNHSIANKYLAEAIAYSTSLRTISFENRPNSFTSKDCKVICEGLLLNKSIDSLVFYHTLDVTDEALECLGQVFKQKKIRSVHFVQFNANPRATEKLVSYITNSDTIDRISMTLVACYQSVEHLFGCLRSKQVKKFAIRRSAITSDQFNVLARYVNKSNITRLNLGHSMPEMNLTPIISAKNSVKKLTMQNNIRTVAEFTSLINAMKNNKTIEALKLDSDQNPPEDPINLAEQIGSLLVETKTLKRISFVDRSLTQYAINGIARNTSLTALDLTVMTAELYDDLCETIINHPSIQKIKIRSVQTPNHFSSLNLIQKSKTLQDIDISDSENLDEDILKNICMSIADKNVIRRIRLTLDTVSLVKNDLYWQTVTDCTSLYCFEIDYSCSKPFSAAIWSKIEAVLEKNSGIISIGKFTDSPEKVRQLLQKNNDIRLHSVANTKTLVSMMAKRSDSFTEKLPMEIWAMILKRIIYFGVDIDFAKMLLNSMNKS